MKIAVCHGLALGELPGADLPVDRLDSWQADKVNALKAFLQDACDAGAQACVLAGGTFARGFVSQSVCESAWQAMCASSIPVNCVLLTDEALGIEGRLDGLAGVGLSRLSEGESIALPCGLTVKAVAELAGIETYATSVPQAAICMSAAGASLVNQGSARLLGPLEPSSFSDSAPSGYLLCDIADGQVTSTEWAKRSAHPYILKQVCLDGAESGKDVAVTVGNAVKDLPRQAFLRIELRGRLPLSASVNTESLAERLNRYFYYVEVADLSSLDLDADELGGDVSLLGEFVRQVIGDDSLSETEKTRILRCGWGALNGKDLAE